MSSSEFKNIYEHAAAIVRARLFRQPGVDEVLMALSERVPDSEQDPRVHRELFFEPRIEAQQIGVSVETAEFVAIELQRIGVLRFWVRITCPEVDECEVGTILETDDPEELETLSLRSCDHCGRHHDLGWENCETVYAVGTRLQGNERSFDFSRLKSPLRSSGKSESSSLTDERRCETLTERSNSGDSVCRIVVLSLRSNQLSQDIPDAFKVWAGAWGGPMVILLLYFLIIIPLTWLAGERLAWAATILVFLVIFVVIRGQVQERLAPTAVQRVAMYMGFPISACCLTAGATGLHINAGVGDGMPWWSRLEVGGHSVPLILAGVVLFVALLLFVWGYDFARGWFSRIPAV